MEDLLVQVLREGKKFHSFMLTLGEGGKKIFGRGEKEMPKGWTVLPSGEASKKHFQILRQGGKYFVEDLKSTNGTLVNGICISHRQELKQEGWIIQPGITSKVVVEIIPVNVRLFVVSENEDASYFTEETKETDETSILPINGGRFWRTKNAKMKAVFALIKKFASASCPILLQGEPGTGKKMLAKSLHILSNRQNYCYFPASELNGEAGWDRLVGHCQGAFAGAIADTIGLLQSHNEGTFFLDEVDSLSSTAQARLLSLCNFEWGDNKVYFYKNGSIVHDSAEIRIISATTEILSHKKFRPELLDQISTVPIGIPPLREIIQDDFDFLFEMVAGQIQRSMEKKIQIDTEGKQKLLCHEYPGNLPEFRRILFQAFASSASLCITKEAIEQAIQKHHASTTKQKDKITQFIRESPLKEIEKYLLKFHAHSGKTKTQTAKFMYEKEGRNATALLNHRLQEYGLADLWKDLK